jgi:hypothetical protein
MMKSVSTGHLLTTSNVEMLNRSFRNAPARDMLAFMTIVDSHACRARPETTGLVHTDTSEPVKRGANKPETVKREANMKLIEHMTLSEQAKLICHMNLSDITGHGVYVRECVTQLGSGFLANRFFLNPDTRSSTLKPVSIFLT